MLSGSSLYRAEACPVSEALPHRNTISADSDRGTVVHNFLYEVTTMGREDALHRVPDEYRALCECIELDKLPASNPDAFRAECAFIWNVATSTALDLGPLLDRKYPTLHASDIPCTLDNVGIAADGETAIITDYKGGHSDAAPAHENLQLRFGALCFCRANGLEKAHVSIIRIKEDGSSWYDAAELSEWDLTVTEGQIAAIMDNVTDAQLAMAQGMHVKPTMGEHCRYCPAYANCHEVNALAVAVGEGSFGIELNEANAAAAWHRIKAMEKIIKEVKAAVKGFAEIAPIDLGNGKMLGEVEGERKTIQGGVAYRIVNELYGEDAANDACEMKSSQAGIERAIKPIVIANGGKLAPAKREIMERIAEISGVHVHKTRSVKEHKARIASQ